MKGECARSWFCGGEIGFAEKVCLDLVENVTDGVESPPVRAARIETFSGDGSGLTSLVAPREGGAD